jgi:hypothetical protein
MIRNLMLGMSLVALTTASAMAAPAAAHKTKANVVAQAGDAPAPSTDKPAKKPAKHTKKPKGDAKADSKTPAPEAPKAN